MVYLKCVYINRLILPLITLNSIYPTYPSKPTKLHFLNFIVKPSQYKLKK